MKVILPLPTKNYTSINTLFSAKLLLISMKVQLMQYQHEMIGLMSILLLDVKCVVISVSNSCMSICEEYGWLAVFAC